MAGIWKVSKPIWSEIAPIAKEPMFEMSRAPRKPLRMGGLVPDDDQAVRATGKPAGRHRQEEGESPLVGGKQEEAERIILSIMTLRRSK